MPVTMNQSALRFGALYSYFPVHEVGKSPIKALRELQYRGWSYYFATGDEINTFAKIDYFDRTSHKIPITSLTESQKNDWAQQLLTTPLFSYAGESFTGKELLALARKKQRFALLLPAIGPLAKIPSRRYVAETDFPDAVNRHLNLPPEYLEMGRELLKRQFPDWDLSTDTPQLRTKIQAYFPHSQATDTSNPLDNIFGSIGFTLDPNNIYWALNQLAVAGFLSKTTKNDWVSGPYTAYRLTRKGLQAL